MSLYDLKANTAIRKAAEKLKTELEMPEWASYVKTSTARERPPADQDWWWMRAAQGSFQAMGIRFFNYRLHRVNG